MSFRSSAAFRYATVISRAMPFVTLVSTISIFRWQREFRYRKDAGSTFVSMRSTYSTIRISRASAQIQTSALSGSLLPPLPGQSSWEESSVSDHYPDATGPLTRGPGRSFQPSLPDYSSFIDFPRTAVLGYSQPSLRDLVGWQTPVTFQLLMDTSVHSIVNLHRQAGCSG
jgi:hypothetical protein